MPQTLLQMANELVIAQVHAYHLTSEEANALLQSTHDTLRSLYQAEMSGSAPARPELQRGSAPVNWRQSIAKHAIICLECGDSFRQLSNRHLRLHNLDVHAYRAKYGIPSTQPLSSRQATARRKQLAREIRPWEGVTAKRARQGTREVG